MRSLMINAVVHPLDLRWWQWGKISGLLLPILCFGLGVEHPLVWAVAAHFLMDFTLQSDQTVAGKARRDWWVLVYKDKPENTISGFLLVKSVAAQACHFDPPSGEKSL